MSINKSFSIFLITVFCLIKFNFADSEKLFRSGDLTKIFFPQNLACGSSTRFKKISLKNPASLVNECKYTIKPFSTRVCQLRIDFDTILAQPRVTSEQTYPKCVDDAFRINDVEICGNNVKQHIYIPFDVQRMSDSVSINVRVADRMKDPSLGAVLWSATVRQLECSEKAFLLQYDKFLAPVGCLQYFYERSGVIESWNYNQGAGPYMGNMSYAICFKRESPRKTLNLKVLSFGLSQAAPDGDGYDTDCVPRILTPGGNEDHLTIPEAIKQNATIIRASKFCGSSLANSTIAVNAPGPFILHFHSDTQYDGQNTTEHGFKIEYNIS